MCGIAGFVGRGDESTLHHMTRTLQHRGPDGEGFFFNLAQQVGFGHRRLSIIDVEGGLQPMFGEDRNVAVIFNGEIYNFEHLRDELAARHRFATHSDTEVIVHGYEEWGAAVFEKLDGMFAIAIWDARQQKVFLARDRFGEKPLYWTHQQGVLVFASEPRALFCHPAVQKAEDIVARSKFFLYEYVPAPSTIYEGVFKLEPATFLEYRLGGDPKISTYYSLLGVRAAVPASEREALEMLDTKLADAVSSRMISDVPLGVFLSGGIDSSTVAYYAQQKASQPIKTFSIGFEEESFDESLFARRVAGRIGSLHHERRFTERECLDVIPRIFEKLDEPLADASLLPTYLLASFARRSVTVALGGDGMDELMLGYPTFAAHRLWEVWHKMPSAAHSLAKHVSDALPASDRNFDITFKLRKFLSAPVGDTLLRDQLWLGSFTPDMQKELFKTALPEAILLEDISRLRDLTGGRDRFAALSFAYLKRYMAEDILTKIDRASMYHSLEVRAPFLAQDAAEYLFSLPASMKMRRSSGKYLLKKLMAPRLGRDIVYRRKKGFGIPLAKWLRKDLRDIVDEHLAPSVLRADGIFQESYVRRLVDDHMERRRDNRKKLWTILVYQMWRARFGV